MITIWCDTQNLSTTQFQHFNEDLVIPQDFVFVMFSLHAVPIFTMYYLLFSGFVRIIYQNLGCPDWLNLVFEDWYFWCEIVSKIVPIFLWLAVIFCDTWWHHGRKGRWPKSDLFYHFMSLFITANHMISLKKLGFDSRRLHQTSLKLRLVNHAEASSGKPRII